MMSTGLLVTAHTLMVLLVKFDDTTALELRPRKYVLVSAGMLGVVMFSLMPPWFLVTVTHSVHWLAAALGLLSLPLLLLLEVLPEFVDAAASEEPADDDELLPVVAV